MASLLLKGVHKRLGLSCTSADATSIVFSASTRRAIDRSSTSKQHGATSSSKKKTTTTTADADAVAASVKSSEKRLVSPATSSRFLLNSSRLQSDDIIVDQLQPPSFIDVKAVPPFAADEVQMVSAADQSSASSSSDSEIVAAATTIHDHEEMKKTPTATARRSCSSSTATSRAREQGEVVVLRVSLHCKGCAGKVKKHISRMEGVTSFDIDIASKKVTVVGDVTPLGVLNSVSKVKPAQLWPSPPPPRASASF